MKAAIEIDLAGATVALEGDTNPIAVAALAALVDNGGRIVKGTAFLSDILPDILLVSVPLFPGPASADPRALCRSARKSAEAMAARGNGRIVFLLSALAAMPMRRHPDFSADMASVLACVRTLAMQFGPKVLVNAVGLGPVETEPMLSGDVAQLSHIPLARSATVAEAVAAVLFLCDPMNSYTTGQMLAVDGGWTAGYGRNF